MSRSKRFPYCKDKGMSTQTYWSRIRRKWKIELKSNYLDPDFHFKNPKSIIDDYDYCDWVSRIAIDKENRLIDKEIFDLYSRK